MISICGKKYPSKIDGWKTFEKNNLTTAVFCILKYFVYFVIFCILKENK